jgi:hypothetical protein
MTYKQGCKYAALLGIPCLIFDVIARTPPFFHMAGMRTAAQLVLFPGWQAATWLTGGVMSRTVEYKLLMPLLIIALNVLAWGGVIWECSGKQQAISGHQGHHRKRVLRSDVDELDGESLRDASSEARYTRGLPRPGETARRRADHFAIGRRKCVNQFRLSVSSCGRACSDGSHGKFEFCPMLNVNILSIRF